MVTEAARPEGERQLDPVQGARREFNNELFGNEYNGLELTLKTLHLQNVLLESNLPQESIFQELTIITRQGLHKAELNNDTNTASVLTELQRGYELVSERFRPESQKDRQTQEAGYGRMLTIEEVAQRLRVNETTIKHYLDEGFLKGIIYPSLLKDGRGWYMVRESFIEEFFARNQSAAKK